jgi:transcriptional regulator with XRE-family HTH domain
MSFAAARVIQEARRKARLSQRQLAVRLGLQQSAIARWESGRVAPSYDAVLRLVRACGWDLALAPPPLTPEQIAQVFAKVGRFRQREEQERAFLAARKAGSTQTYREFVRELKQKEKR